MAKKPEQVAADEATAENETIAASSAVVPEEQVVRLSCFYGDAQPGDEITVDATEAARLVELGAGVIEPK